MQNLQLYAREVSVDSEAADVLLVTLTMVDVGDLAGQVSIDELLDGWDYDQVEDYLKRRREEDTDE